MASEEPDTERLHETSTESQEPAGEQHRVAVADQPLDKLLHGAWILQKVRALGELVPGAAIELERLLDEGEMPGPISGRLLREHGVRLSELEVARYSAWLPHIRRETLRRAEVETERAVQEVRRNVRTRSGRR